MKLTKKFVRWFEKEQEAYGTKTALHNVLFLTATDILHDIGIKSVRSR